MAWAVVTPDEKYKSTPFMIYSLFSISSLI